MMDFLGILFSVIGITVVICFICAFFSMLNEACEDIKEIKKNIQKTELCKNEVKE